jgi:hypothetical protein
MKRTAALIALLVVLFPVLSCTRPTEEDRIRKIVSTIQSAAEKKRIRVILDQVSKTYHDPRGNDYDGIKGLLSFYFFRHKTVGVFLPSIEASAHGQEGAAQFTAVLSAKGIDGEEGSIILPDAMGAYNFDVSFRKEGGAWKVISASWQRAMEEGEGR